MLGTPAEGRARVWIPALPSQRDAARFLSGLRGRGQGGGSPSTTSRDCPAESSESPRHGTHCGGARGPDTSPPHSRPSPGLGSPLRGGSQGFRPPSQDPCCPQGLPGDGWVFLPPATRTQLGCCLPPAPGAKGNCQGQGPGAPAHPRKQAGEEGRHCHPFSHLGTVPRPSHPLHKLPRTCSHGKRRGPGHVARWTPPGRSRGAAETSFTCFPNKGPKGSGSHVGENAL